MEGTMKTLKMLLSASIFLASIALLAFPAAAYQGDDEYGLYSLVEDSLLGDSTGVYSKYLYLTRIAKNNPLSISTVSIQEPIPQPAPLANTSVYMIPKNSSEGGIDVNIIDWLPSSDLTVTGYNVYRREFGTNAWTPIADAGTKIRYFDQNITATTAYQYEVRPYTAQGELAPISMNMSTNYVTRESSGLQPDNVLVLISTNEPGFVNIAEIVPGYETSNGMLDPITEAQLQAFLGYTPGNTSFYNIIDPDGTAHNTTWHVIKHADGKIEVPLGVYYAIRRGIPKENIVFLDNIPRAENETDFALGPDAYQQYVIQPIKSHMIRNGLVNNITSIVSAYHFPIKMRYPTWETRSWDDGLGSYLWQALGGDMADIPDRVGNGHHFSRILGDTGFLCTRIDAANIDNARRLIDDSIWAEQNYFFYDPAWRATNGLNAFIDWQGPYATGNSWFLISADALEHSGLFGSRGQNWDMAPDLNQIISQYDQDHDGRLDNTFLYTGWYNYYNYQDWFNWARGAIGWNLDSLSGASFRNASTAWGTNIINRGAAASLGAVGEPYLTGHTRPDIFMHYILNGYSFAEAAYYSSPTAGGGTPWMMAFDGDPLYSPFGRSYDWRSYSVIINGMTYIRYETEGAYRDYDLDGNLACEMLGNKMKILHLEDGRTVFYKTCVSDDELKLAYSMPWLRFRLVPDTDLFIYDTDGSMLFHSQIPLGHIEQYNDGRTSVDIHYNDDIVLENDSFVIYRRYNDGPVDIFDQNGSLVITDSITGNSTRYVVKRGGDIVTSPSFPVMGIPTYGLHSSGYQVITSIGIPQEFRFDISYGASTSDILEGRYYDGRGDLIAVVSENTLTGYCIFTDTRTGVSSIINQPMPDSARSLYLLTIDRVTDMAVGTWGQRLNNIADYARQRLASRMGIAMANITVTDIISTSFESYSVTCLADNQKLTLNIGTRDSISRGGSTVETTKGEGDLLSFVENSTGRDCMKELYECATALLGNFRQTYSSMFGAYYWHYQNGVFSIMVGYTKDGSCIGITADFTSSVTTQTIENYDALGNGEIYYATSNYNGPDGLRTTTIDTPLYAMRYSAPTATAKPILTSFVVKHGNLDLLPATANYISSVLNPAVGEGVGFDSWTQAGDSIRFTYRLADNSTISVNVNTATGVASMDSALEQAISSARDFVAHRISSPQPVQTEVEGIFQYESPGPNDPIYRFTISTITFTFTIDYSLPGGQCAFTMRSIVNNFTGDDMMTIAGAASISVGVYRGLLSEPGMPNYNPAFDLNGSGVINAVDLQILKNLMYSSGQDMSWVMAVGRALAQSEHDELTWKDTEALLSKVTAALGKRGGDAGWNDVSIYDFDFDGDIDEVDLQRAQMVTDALNITPPAGAPEQMQYNQQFVNGDPTVGARIAVESAAAANQAEIQASGASITGQIAGNQPFQNLQQQGN
jgi:uncharacterized protein (TIGR03790 family)